MKDTSVPSEMDKTISHNIWMQSICGLEISNHGTHKSTGWSYLFGILVKLNFNIIQTEK